MITRLPGFPNNIIGVSASGKVTAADYETVVIPAVDAALKTHKKLRLIYEIAADCTGFAPGAVWDDMKVGLEHLSAWERAAIVTDIDWIAKAMNAFKFVMPCPVRVFPLKDRAAAEAWIAS